MKRPSVAVAALLAAVQVPVFAQGRAAGGKMAVREKARALPLTDVRLTGGPLKAAQDQDAKYLLALEPDRMMVHLRIQAGLEPRNGAKPYGGWEGGPPPRQLTGHIAGHYLSAVSLMYAATGDLRFKERADYLVEELKEVQDKQGDGYIGAQSDSQGTYGKVRFQELAKGIIRSGGFDLNGLWSPWYVEHKIFAGLRDAYRFAGNRTALEVEIKFAAWVESILAGLDDSRIQQMLGTEFGGMNEVLAELYADTGEKRWLALSGKFEHHAIIDPLSRGEDILAGKHGNTQVPKLLGSLMRYICGGNETDGRAARFFWDQVALHHSFATGGHGRNEYFGEPGKLSNMIEGRTCETCNVYNMIKMARDLFALQPEMRYADFHERALFNHVLGSMDPSDGTTCYMVPVGQGVSREYQDMFQDFTCCVGSGMESHALHADGLYYESGDKLWVNLYAPSTAVWRAPGVSFAMETGFPEGDAAALKFTLKSARAFTLALRRPYWSGGGCTVKVNGRPLKSLPPPGSYVEIRRTWRSGDTVDLVLRKALRLEPLPDNPNRVAVMWGPLVLAGDLGPIPARGAGSEGARGPSAPAVPAFLAAGKQVSGWLKPVEGKPGTFRTDGVGRDRDVEFVPFYRLHRRLYGAYWDLYTPEEWDRSAAEVRAAEDRRRKIEAATVAFVQPGRMETEREFNMKGENSSPVTAQGRYGRRGTGWFSFDVPVDPAHPMVLLVTYNRNEQQTRTFDILVDGVRVAEQSVRRLSPQEQSSEFFDVEYGIPAGLVRDKQKVTVRFQAAGGDAVASVFGIRMFRGDLQR